ncbi:hypothetical protein QQ020_21175 [Fulvivirgaceae bacterium BMA12]|uniref:ATPase n=1 Tax=Agaribacillus aureus TaxID=3051825 RepID=A0ABT8LBN4_9BACT|nr:hypothetical protein [Fulvivirgaceae bacterium BMA12]
MSKAGKENVLIANLNAYKRKYYQNQLLKGGLFLFASLLGAYLVVNSLAFIANFDTTLRAILFFSFITFGLIVSYKWIIDPITRLFYLRKQISDEEAARQIGSYFPEIEDKLLNTLQLQKISDVNSDLIAASIRHRTDKIGVIPFTQAIDLGENRKYLKYAVVPVIVIFILLFFAPSFLKDSTTKIINYNKDYLPVAPFQFVLGNETLRAFKNEDFTITLDFEGKAIPENAFVLFNNRRIKMESRNQAGFAYTFKKIQHNTNFSFEAAGFYSGDYTIEVVNRPNLKNFNVVLNFPRYVKRDNQTLQNIGNIEVPQGTIIEWHYTTLDAEKMKIIFGGEKAENDLEMIDNQVFTYKRKVFKSQDYQIKLQNEYSDNKEKINYHIEVIPDQYPSITLDQFKDTTLYSYTVLGGNIADDYGLSQLSLFYKKTSSGTSKEADFQAINIPIDKNRISQSYYYQMLFDSIDLNQGDKVEYYLQVWDNDAVNGRKSSKTGTYIFNIPDKSQLKESIAESSKNAEKQIDETLEKASELKEKLKEEEDRLKTEKSLQWQDEKRLEEILKKREELNEAIKKLQDLNRATNQKRERFSENSKKIKEKAQQLQKLMDELLDEETKRLYDELQKLMQEKTDMNKVQDILEKLNNKEDNLEKELERSLELFKKLKFDYKLEETINELNESAKEQEELSEKTQDKSNDIEDLQEEQQELNEQFEETEKALEELNEMNQDRKNPDAMQDTSEEQKEIDQLQKESQENLENNKRKKAAKSQQQSAEKMQEMSQKLQQMQNGAEMEMMMENLDNLRDIVDNLVKLSFDQEKLMIDFRNVKQSDPRFIPLSQQQLKLKDDSKIIEDSLLALSERVFQIASFVTRELGEMSDNMDKTIKALRDRKKSLAVSKQQFTMTSINNLALLLDDVLQQMQQQMADAMGKPQKGNKGKNMPGLSELQKQLNQQIQQLQKSGKSGRQLSEELAKLAAEQQRLRQALQEMNEKYGNNGEEGGKDGGKAVNDLLDKMEETETDLVNKRLSSEMIERQREILTRLLEAENALRERELDEKREAEKAKDYEKRLPKAFEEYIKLKEKEIELLKTVPLRLNPYYKKEVNEYFKRIEK